MHRCNPEKRYRADHLSPYPSALMDLQPLPLTIQIVQFFFVIFSPWLKFYYMYWFWTFFIPFCAECIHANVWSTHTTRTGTSTAKNWRLIFEKCSSLIMCCISEELVLLKLLNTVIYAWNRLAIESFDESHLALCWALCSDSHYRSWSQGPSIPFL